MKNLLLISIVFLISFGCSKPEYKINFCTRLTPEIECKPSLSTFKKGTRVYVLFECNQPFIEEKITGKFSYIENGRKIEVGSQDWTLKKGDSYAYDYVDFTDSGIYEFEFLNANDLLAKKRLEIK